MVRVLDVATQGAIRNPNAIVPRDFVVITAKHRTTGAPQVHGFWNDGDTVTTNVVSGEDDTIVSHTFQGDGAILSCDPIPMRIGLEVRTIQMVMSPLHGAVKALLRTDDPRFGKVEIYRGYLDPLTMVLASEPRIRFLGRINGAPIDTPAAGGEARAVLKIVSHTRELTRTNPAKKSDEEQRKRDGDRFRRYTGVAGEWPIWWGEEKDNGGGKR
jgi:hypothetical protein